MDELDDFLLTGFELGSPADPGDIAQAEATLGIAFPPVLRRLLLASDGRQGTLPASDEFICLYSVEQLLEANDEDFRDAFAGYLAIGDNGGLETYALDLREPSQDPPMVRIDRVDADSALEVGPTLLASIRALSVPDA